MKKYLLENRPKFTITLILILFLSTIITFLLPGINNLIFLRTDNLTQAFNWYRFLTYPLITGGILNWLHNSLVLILTGYIFENRTIRKQMISICLISTLVGGLVFVLSNHNTIQILIGPSMISWGYLAATIVCGFKNWKTLNLFEKIIFILSMISLLSVIAPDDIGIIFGQIAVVISVIIFAFGFKTFKK